jgi:hypothetical protein
VVKGEKKYFEIKFRSDIWRQQVQKLGALRNWIDRFIIHILYISPDLFLDGIIDIHFLEKDVDISGLINDLLFFSLIAGYDWSNPTQYIGIGDRTDYEDEDNIDFFHVVILKLNKKLYCCYISITDCNHRNERII